MLELLRRDHPDGGSSFVIAPTFDDPYLELVRLLHEACEIEHSLMLQYLYAAYSIRPRYAALVGAAGKSSTTMLGVAIQEMHHLHLVNRMLVELDAAPNLELQGFPYEPGLYPFPMMLEPLSRASLAKYVYAEAPRGVFEAASADPDQQTFVAEMRRLLPKQPLNHVGSLYGTILELLDRIARPHAPIARWKTELAHIRSEGETDHYEFFRSVFLGTHPALADVAEVWADPWSEVYPSTATMVVAPTHAEGATSPAVVAAARVGNHVYWTVLLLLDAGYRMQNGGAVLHRLATVLMSEGIHPIAQALAEAGLGLPYDPFTIGHDPGVDVLASLEVATGLLGSGRTLLAAAAPTLGETRAARLGDLLQRTQQRVRFAIRDQRPEVLVVGAGPAGLAAAAALVERKIPVHLVESAPIVGGKANSRRTKAGRSEEHGVHGWWPSYKNFDRLLTRAGVVLDQALRAARGGAILVRPYETADLKDRRPHLPSPLFLIPQLGCAPYLSWGDLLSAVGFGIHALAFDHARDYPRYDRVSFAELATRLGASPDLQKFVLRPFAMCFDYAPPEQVSAASVLSALQFYLLPSQGSIRPRWSKGLPQETVFGPLAKSIADRGGLVDRRTTVLSVEIRDQAVTGARVLDASAGFTAGGTDVVAEVPLAALAAGTFVAVDSDAGPLWVAKLGGTYRAFSAVCPHLGGRIQREGDRFVCDLHKGEFGDAGQVLKTPPTDPLYPLAFREKGTVLEIIGTKSVRVIPCSHVIIATDVPHAQKILGLSAGVPPTLVDRVNQLRTTPVIVTRLWLESGAPVPDIETIVLPDPVFADVFFHLNAIDRSYDREGVIVELHCCDVEDGWLKASDDTILDLVFRDLATLHPGLTRDRMLAPDAYVILRHEAVFTLYAPNDASNRPGAGTGIAGLHLAGDWTTADWSVWMMERAVVSGLRAANRVLASYDLPAAPIERLDPEGPLLVLSRWLARGLRWMFHCRVP